MGTANKRVAAYLPQQVAESFERFKQDRSIGDSQALLQILSEYFAQTSQVAGGAELQLVNQRLNALESMMVESQARSEDTQLIQVGQVLLFQ
jgi:hypothetical protein